MLQLERNLTDNLTDNSCPSDHSRVLCVYYRQTGFLAGLRESLPMTPTRGFGLVLILSIMFASWIFPASAADLAIPPIHKAKTAVLVKSVVRSHPMRIAAAQLAPVPECVQERIKFPLVLGVAY